MFTDVKGFNFGSLNNKVLDPLRCFIGFISDLFRSNSARVFDPDIL